MLNVGAGLWLNEVCSCVNWVAEEGRDGKEHVAFIYAWKARWATYRGVSDAFAYK